MRVAIAPIEWDVVDLADSCGYEVVGFFDKRGEKPYAPLLYLGNDDAWPDFHRASPDVGIIVVVEPAVIREKLHGLFGRSVLTVISPAAHVSSRSVIGAGSVLQRNVTVMAQAALGRGCSLNVGATIHHECQIGDFCTIGPGAILAGAVKMESYSYIGAGAVVLQNVTIGRGAKVGAGAVVLGDVAPGEVVVGIPARARPQ
jgi:sugar O-acyltransferase (sialic acid O-acetyltransferase NeuD family)